MAGARRSGRVGALAATIVQVAALGAGALTSFVVARRLGAEGTGIFAVAGQFVLIGAVLGGLGLRTGIAHEISAGRLSRHAAATEATLLSLGLGVVAGAAGFALYELGSETVFEGIDAPLAAVLAASVPFAVAWWVLAAIPLAEEDYEEFAVLQSSPFVLLAVMVVPLTLSVGTDGVLIAVAGSFGLAGAGSVAWALRHTAGDAGGGWHLAESVRMGLRGWMLEMLQLLPLRPDIIIVAGYGAATDAGVYSLAVSITAVGWVLPQAVGTIALPLVASDVASSADATAGEGAAVPRPLATRALRHGVLLSIVAGVGVGAMLLAVPPIFGEDFDRTVGLGLIMLPGVIALALGRVMIGLLLGLGRANAVLAIGLAVVPPALAAYLLAVPGGGPTAAAIVSGAAYLLTTLGASLALRREGLRLSRAALTPRRADLRDYLPARRP